VRVALLTSLASTSLASTTRLAMSVAKRPRTGGVISMSTGSSFGSLSERASALIEDIMTTGERGLRRKGSKLMLLHADFCPFAHRAWISLLEKEPDPTRPTLFDEMHSCYWMGERDPGTAVLYEMGLKTLPAAVFQGQILSESALVADFIDELIPGPALKPSDPLMRFNMNHFREVHAPIVGTFYSYLRSQDETTREELRKEYTALLATFDANLGKFDGPYLCGEQFTLADIDLVGFIERTIHVLPLYRGFVVPSHLSRIPAWWAAVSERASVKVVTSRRAGLSVATQAFEAIERVPYLQEVYETYAADDLPLCRKVMAESGAPGYNAYHRHKQEG